MNYGLYLSAGGALTSLHRQDVIANNLANLHTVGFKPDAVFTRQRLPERLESPDVPADPHWLLERLGGGLLVEPTRIDLTQGTLIETGNPLDLAIRGEGFFVVAAGEDAGEQRLHLTRDGRLTRNERGELVMAATGLPVLDADDRTIRLSGAGTVRIEPDGTVTQDGEQVARLQLIAPPDPARLVKVGDNLMKPQAGTPLPRLPGRGAIVQAHIEASAVDPITTLNDMIGATKSAQANLKMMQYHDHILGMAVNTFGRVA